MMAGRIHAVTRTCVGADQRQTTRDMKMFPEERFRGESRWGASEVRETRVGRRVQELLEDAAKAIHAWQIVFSRVDGRVESFFLSARVQFGPGVARRPCSAESSLEERQGGV
jgi:hypothetical protein